MDQMLPGTPVSIDIDGGDHQSAPESNRTSSRSSITSKVLKDNNESPLRTDRQRSKNIFSRGSSKQMAGSEVSIRSVPRRNGTENETAFNALNGAIVDDDSGLEISELSDVADSGSPLHIPRDFTPSLSPPAAASYHVATRSIPKRPNTAAGRPQSSMSNHRWKTKFVTQSIPNLRQPLNSATIVSGHDRKSKASTSSSSSSTGSRPASGRSSALSRLSNAFMSKLQTSKITEAWDDELTSDLPSRPDSASRPQTSASMRSGTESADSTGDQENQRDQDLQWRSKLRINCFLPCLSDKYLCPACDNVLYYPVQLSNCDHHVCSTCLANVMRGVRTCPLDGKPIDRSQVIVQQDFSEELLSKKLACPQSDVGCPWFGAYGSYKAHYSTCEHAESVCPNGCGLRCARNRMDEHSLKECSLRMVTCEFCVRAIRAEKEIDHLKQCPRFPVTCPNGCGMKEIPREDLPKHVEENCPLGEIKCPFRRTGCYETGTREFIKQHIAEEMASHIEMLCAGLNQNADKLQDHEDAIAKQQASIDENGFQTSNLLKRQGCQFLWKIDNWSQRAVDATAGRKTILKSPPFYSGRYGYKLGLSMMPNGDGAAKGSNLSIYICVCKGEYDALLTWPFSMSVTFTLVDQCQDPRAKVDHVYVLRPNPCKENLPFLGRPTANSNPSFGAQNFAPLDMLETRDYVREDVVFIKIVTETDN